MNAGKFIDRVQQLVKPRRFGYSLAQERNLWGQIGVEVQDELPFVKSTLDSVLIGGSEIEVAESGNL